MYVMILDTETIGLNNPYIYNIGYVVLNTEKREMICGEDFVIEQVWSNKMLFNTAYYADKRPLYINKMKGRAAEMVKFGHCLRRLKTILSKYEINTVFAYNSSFDEKAINFTCDYFQKANPFDSIPFYDIRKYAIKGICDNENYKLFCDKNSYYTDSGNYSTTAENVFRYITNNTAFDEEHTALADAMIETEILLACIANDSDLTYTAEPFAKSSIEKIQDKTLTVYINKEEKATFTYNKKITRNDKIYLTKF